MGCGRRSSSSRATKLLVVEDLQSTSPVTRGIIFQKEVALREGRRRSLVRVARARRSASSANRLGKSTMARCIMKLLEPTGAR